MMLETVFLNSSHRYLQHPMVYLIVVTSTLMIDLTTNSFISLNADIAGMMVRTELNVYPWYSPAGVQRGGVNNIVKLDLMIPHRHIEMHSTRIESIQLFPIRVVDSFSSEIRLLLDIILHLIELTFVASSLYLRRQLKQQQTLNCLNLTIQSQDQHSSTLFLLT